MIEIEPQRVPMLLTYPELETLSVIRASRSCAGG